jgi:hypothetical protein
MNNDGFILEAGTNTNSGYSFNRDGGDWQRVWFEMDATNDLLDMWYSSGNGTTFQIFNNLNTQAMDSITVFRPADSSASATPSVTLNFFAMWNGTMNDIPLELTEDVTPPTVTIHNPTNNTRTNQNIDFNITSNENSSCTLLNESDILDTDATVIENIPFMLSYTVDLATTQTNVYTVNCTDSSNNSGYDYLTMNIDTINPILTVNNPADLDTFNPETENITYDIECSDLYPYLLNMTFYNGTGVLYTVQNATPTGYDMTLTGTLDISNYGVGTYYANYSCSDTHTLSEWSPDYKVTPKPTGIELEFDGYEKLEFEIDNIEGASYDYFTVNKEIDRLTFDIGFTDTITEFKFIITANDIKYLSESDYKGHLIINNRYWYDTEPYDTTVDIIDTDKVEITFSGLNTNNVLTESIGGLNIVEVMHTYTLSIPVIETPSQIPLEGTLDLLLSVCVFFGAIILIKSVFKEKK